jgi:hypothetical protein
MNAFSKVTDNVVKYPLVALAATIGGIFPVVQFALEKASNLPHTYTFTTTAILSGGFLCVAIYSIVKLTSENRAHKDTYSYLHELNHLYRQKLAGTSAKLLSIDSNDRQRKTDLLLSVERETIKDAVRLISGIFNKLTNRDTTTTIWLYDSATRQATEYISCKDGINSQRERQKREYYDIDENVYLSNCQNLDGKCCHYFGPNLKKLRKKGNWKDERPSNDELYQAILTVPIRYIQNGDENKIGYLQVDQKSTNHINNNDHLFILAACADQLYNFFSIVRKDFLFG